MRTTIDLPDALLRQLKSRAALEGTTLTKLVHDSIERGLRAPGAPGKAARGRSALPSIKIGQPLKLKRLSNAKLADLLDE